MMIRWKNRQRQRWYGGWYSGRISNISVGVGMTVEESASVWRNKNQRQCCCQGWYRRRIIEVTFYDEMAEGELAMVSKDGTEE